MNATQKAQKIHSIVLAKIERIYGGYERGETKALLASLRRGTGKTPGEIPMLWGEVLKNIPEEMMSRTGDATAEEWAVYTSMTLFALHQQGQSKQMHRSGQPLGSAMRLLVKNEEADSEQAEKRHTAWGLSR